MSEAVALLEKSPLFAALAPAHRQQIAGYLTRHEYQTGVEIVRQGDPGDGLYLVAAGSVGVFVRDQSLGITQLISTLESPESFGEMALVSTQPQSGTCTAMQPTLVYRLAKEVFHAVIGQVPQVALAVAGMLAVRLEHLIEERDIPWTSLVSKKFDARLWASLPELTLRQGRIVPLSLVGRTLTLGMVDPLDSTSLDTLARAVPGVKFKIFAVTPEDWQRFVDQGTSKPAAVAAKSPGLNPNARVPVVFIDDEETRQGRASMAGGPSSPAVALVDEIVGMGLGSGASDIHIEHERRGMLVRYRIDGSLQARQEIIPPELGKAIVSRIKLLGKMDITETRKPQDGRISVRAGGTKVVDLRVSSLPSKFGEKIVLRVLDSEGAITDLKTLFAVDKVRQVFAQMVFRPTGLVLVTGPTGSGKTTTMYSALNARRRPELNIVTVEDPIEYHLDGITQVQVMTDAGSSFASILRALLRQDPDVIMVGELRDLDTAKMAVEASLTGHLVITSLHTNGAIEAIARLTDIGVARYAIANGLVGVLHQRLVRRICAQCSEPFEYPPPIIDLLFKANALRPGQEVTLFRGKGCARCNNTGFKGRAALYEILVINDVVRDAISKGADQAGIKAVAAAGAMIELSRYAGLLVTQGITVPGEVLQVIQQVESS